MTLDKNLLNGESLEVKCAISQKNFFFLIWKKKLKIGHQKAKEFQV